MKYVMLTDPDEKLRKGDQAIYRHDLVNEEKLQWDEVSSIGSSVKSWPRHAFRRPVAGPVRVKLNEEYTAIIFPDHVEVGCSSFTHDVILDVAAAIRKLATESQ